MPWMKRTIIKLQQLTIPKNCAKTIIHQCLYVTLASQHISLILNLIILKLVAKTSINMYKFLNV